MDMSSKTDQKGKKSCYMESSRDNQQKMRTKNNLQLQNRSLNFVHKNKSLLSVTSNQSRSPVAYNTTASLDKLSCTDYVDFGKCLDRIGQFSWSKNDSNYLDLKLKVFKKNDNKVFWLVRNLTTGEVEFTSLCNLKISWSLQQKTRL